MLGSRQVLEYKAQEEAGETSKKPVGPCILSPRGVYPRDIEGPCYSKREAMWVHLVLFLGKEVGKSRMTIREDIS